MTGVLFLVVGVMLLPAVIGGCRPVQPTSEQSSPEQPGAEHSGPEQSSAEHSGQAQPTAAQQEASRQASEAVSGSLALEQEKRQRPAPSQVLPAPGLVAPALVSPAAAACGATRSGLPATRDGYKHDVACRIHARNGARLYEGAPPPVLRSVVVLSLRINAQGRPVKIGVLRSNGIRDLERRAMQSVRDAAPFPAPGAAVLRQGVADITETWLFRDDGRFQVRTLAMVQAQSGY